MTITTSSLLPGDDDEGGFTTPFWDGVKKGELRVPECSACSHRFFPPLPACPRCMSKDWSWAVSPGKGQVYAFTLVSRLPGSDGAEPYLLATIDLADGWAINSNIVDCDPGAVSSGMPVAVTFRPIRGGRNLPVFAPAPTKES